MERDIVSRLIVAWVSIFAVLVLTNYLGIAKNGVYVGIGGWILSLVSPFLIIFFHALQKNTKRSNNPLEDPPDTPLEIRFWIWVLITCVFFANAGPLTYRVLEAMGGGEWTNEYRLYSRWQIPLVVFLLSAFIFLGWMAEEKLRQYKLEVDGPH